MVIYVPLSIPGFSTSEISKLPEPSDTHKCPI